MSDPIDIVRLAAERVANASADVMATMTMQAGPAATIAYYTAKLELDLALLDAQAAMDVAKSLNEFLAP